MLPSVIRRVCKPHGDVDQCIDDLSSIADQSSVQDMSEAKEISSDMWQVEFTVPSVEKRSQVFGVLRPLCKKLIVSCKVAERFTSNLANNAPSIVATMIDGVASCWMVEAMTESMLLEKLHSVLEQLAGDIAVSTIKDWSYVVERQTSGDLDCMVLNIDSHDLSLRTRLWWMIHHENILSMRSLNPRLLSVLAENRGAKDLLRNLLNEKRARINRMNPRRVAYGEHQSVIEIDPDIRHAAEWTRNVLDWFAERLPQPNMNVRALYLWGGAGVGKTRLVDRLLLGHECMRRDTSEAFFLQNLSEDYEFVWLDEFVPNLIARRHDLRHQFNKLTGRELNASESEERSAIRCGC
jgi:hypothetical protein